MAWIVAAAALAGTAATAAPVAADATAVGPTAAGWCFSHGATLGTWAPTSPALPICGPGPAYGGTWSIVSIPGPYGSSVGSGNGTPGFQCVEFSDRFLAVVDGLGSVIANGSEVVMNYHAAYPATSVVINGTAGAVGHPPAAGDVLSFSMTPSFYDPTDGHTAVVLSSRVNAHTGNGTVHLAQENVSPSDYLYTLKLVSWRLVDPNEPSDAEFQYPYAEWLVVAPATPATGVVPPLLTPSATTVTTTPTVQLTVAHRTTIRRERVRAAHLRAARLHAADVRATEEQLALNLAVRELLYANVAATG